MKIHLNGRLLDVTTLPLLGEGGEARVYRHGDVALKIFHSAPSGLGPQSTLAKRILDEKFEKVQAFPKVPPQVVAPLFPLRDRRDAFVGYAMPLCENATDAGRLLRPATRPTTLTLADACVFLRRLHATVSALHLAGVVVGDLNDGNVLHKDGDALLIDADSFQLVSGTKTLRCVVAHERYLDPRRYGLDLTAFNGPSAFDVDTDWYAFAVFAFQLLTLVHPYGGTVSGLKTLLRRAEARHSALRKDVVLPRSTLSFAVLPDALREAFNDVFEHDKRGVFDVKLLDASWTRCGCGTEHAQSHCPQCAAQSAQHLAAIGRAPVSHGCREVVVVDVGARGRIRTAAIYGGLQTVIEHVHDDGTRHLSDSRGNKIALDASNADAVHLCAGQIWTVGGGVAVAHGSPPARVAVDATSDGHATFASTATATFAATSGVLWDLQRGVVVGRTLEGQTRLFAGGSKVFGLYRAASHAVAFVHQAGANGTRDVVIGVPRGKLVDTGVEFDPAPTGPILLSQVWDVGGALECRWTLISATAQILAEHRTTMGDGEFGVVTSGRCLAHGVVIVANHDGLVAFKPTLPDAQRRGTFVPVKVFAGTSELVDPSVQLLPSADGDLFVVRPTSVCRLTLG